MSEENFPMQQTHAELGSTLLIQAAKFFRSIAEQNPELAAQMQQNAQTFEQVAQLLKDDPTGVIDLSEEP